MSPPTLLSTLLLTLSLTLPLLSITNAASDPTITILSLPTASASAGVYPYALASSLGLDTYALYPFPVGGTGNWTESELASASTTGTSTSTSTGTSTRSTKSSTSTSTSTRTSTSAVTGTSTKSLVARSTSTAVLKNNATSSTPLLTNLTSSYITSYWSLPKGARRIEFGQNDVTFVDDPDMYNTTSDLSGEEETANGDGQQVLRVEYPEGSYSGGTGGTEFVSTLLANTSSPTALLLTYSLYVPTNFDFNKGGKLPGLRGGSDYFSCSGGDQSGVGSTCFSTRIMWRTGGIGEIYGYIPTSTALCAKTGVVCNDDYGTSLGRGSFTFVPGEWNDVALYVKLNSGTGTADGVVQLYFNNVQAISFTDLSLSTSTSLSSISGLFFSTFFGGDDSSWASPSDQFLYFKDMAVWGSSTEGAGVSDTGTTSGAGGGGVGGLGAWVVRMAAVVGFGMGMVRI